MCISTFFTTKQISNHGVRKSWIYWTLCLLTTWNYMEHFLGCFSIISSNKGGNKWTIWTIGETGQLVDFMEYSRYFQEIYQSQGTKAMLTQETKKVWTLQPKLSLRSGLRSRTGKVQQCSLTQWLHNQTSCTCAALQQQRSSTEEQQACSSSREAEEHLSGMCVMQHISITQ